MYSSKKNPRQAIRSYQMNNSSSYRIDDRQDRIREKPRRVNSDSPDSTYRRERDSIYNRAPTREDDLLIDAVSMGRNDYPIRSRDDMQDMLKSKDDQLIILTEKVDKLIALITKIDERLSNLDSSMNEWNSNAPYDRQVDEFGVDSAL